MIKALIFFMHVLIITPQLLQASTLSHAFKRQNVNSLVISPVGISHHIQLVTDAVIFPHTMEQNQWNLLLSFFENLSTRIPVIFFETNDRLFFQKKPFDRFLTQCIFLDSAIPFSQIPFLIREIVQKSSPKVDMKIGQIALDRMTRSLTFKGQTIELSKKEFFLFELFLMNSGRIISRDYIIDYVWDKRSYVAQNTIDVYISRLRKKIAPYFPHTPIRTIPCLGYQLVL